jgi:hypothetical protein
LFQPIRDLSVLRLHDQHVCSRPDFAKATMPGRCAWRPSARVVGAALLERPDTTCQRPARDYATAFHISLTKALNEIHRAVINSLFLQLIRSSFGDQPSCVAASGQNLNTAGTSIGSSYEVVIDMRLVPASLNAGRDHTRMRRLSGSPICGPIQNRSLS